MGKVQCPSHTRRHRGLRLRVHLPTALGEGAAAIRPRRLRPHPHMYRLCLGGHCLRRLTDLSSHLEDKCPEQEMLFFPVRTLCLCLCLCLISVSVFIPLPLYLSALSLYLSVSVLLYVYLSPHPLILYLPAGNGKTCLFCKFVSLTETHHPLFRHR